MCIRIISSDSEEIKYNSKRPLEEQIAGSKEVIIKYDPKDTDIDKFLIEMRSLVCRGISTNVKVDVVHSNFLKGIKAKQQINRIKKELTVNEAIKLLSNLQSTTDKCLEELSNFCRK
jgi:hypothetical protein